MHYQDAASSHFSIERGSARSHYPADNGSTYSADSRNATRDPRNNGSVDVVTLAQAYATAVRKGSPAHGCALHYTIERRHSEQQGKVESQLIPSHPGYPEHGLTLAQRLYASALSSGSSSIQPPSHPPALPLIDHASSSTRPISEEIQASFGAQHRKTSISPSLFSTSSENSLPFNPSDLYHTSAVKHGLQSRGPTSSGGGAMRPPPLLPASQTPSSSHPPYETKLWSPHSPLQSAILEPEVLITRPMLQPSPNPSVGGQSNGIPTVDVHESSSLPAMSTDARREPHTSPVSGGTEPSSLPLEQQLMTPPSLSPPPFEEYDQLSIPSQDVVADIAPIILRPPVVVSHESPPDDDHEEVPLYTLVDEELPPPAFDDIQVGTRVTEGFVDQSEASPDTIEAPAVSSQFPTQSPPPFSHSPSPYSIENTPMCTHPEGPSFSVGRGRNTVQENRIPLSFTGTSRSSDRPLSDPLNVAPSTSPPVSPSSAVSHNEIMTTPITPLFPSDSYPSAAPSCLSDGQCIGTLYCSPAVHGSPPLVNYRTKPTARESGQSFLPLPTLRSGPRPPETSNRRNSRSLVGATEDNIAIGTLTRSLSDMMKGPSSATHNFAYENVSSGEQNILRTSFGNEQNIPISLASHPSGTRRIIENHETFRTEAERLTQEAYQRPTHAKTGGRTGHSLRTQGSGPANPGAVSSQYLPPTVPFAGLIPPAHSHDKFYTETICTTGVLNQFGETPALSSRISFHSDRFHIASTQPTPPFPYPLQPSHHSISGGTHGPVAPAESVPRQRQSIHSVQTSDLVQRGCHPFPPLPPLPPPPPPPVGLPSWNASKTPPASSCSQDSTQDQFNQAPTLTSNDLARKFARDALRSLG